MLLSNHQVGSLVKGSSPYFHVSEDWGEVG